MPRSCTSKGRCGTAWQASSTVNAPWHARPRRGSRTGLTVPRTLETWAKAKTLVRSVSRPSRPDRSSRPSSVTGTQRSVAPVRRVRLLPRHEVGVVLHLGDEHLVALAQVETLVLRLSGNGVGERVGREVERLVAFLVKTTSPGWPPTKEATRARRPRSGRWPPRRGGALRGAPRRWPLRHTPARRPAPATAGARWHRSRGTPAASPAHGARQDREVGPDAGRLPRAEGRCGHDVVSRACRSGRGGQVAVVALRLEAVGELGPPSSTILPSMKTCTKSGLM